MKGLKFRIGGFAGTIVSKLGVVPQQLAGGDIYPALEKGTLDACEWVGPYDDEKLGFHKVAKYYYYPGWWEGCGQGHNLINLAKWNELPKPYQAAIITASGETWEWVLGKYDHRQSGGPQAPDRRRGAAARLPAGHHGGELQGRQRDLRRACRRPTRISRSCYDSLVAFRGDSYQWMQVAEMGFDSFMMRMRSRS